MGYRHNWLRRWFRRWLFRRMFKDHQVPGCQPKDRQIVIVLDDDHPTPVWIAEYNAEFDSYSAEGGWFEATEIVYWTPTRGLL